MSLDHVLYLYRLISGVLLRSKKLAHDLPSVPCHLLQSCVIATAVVMALCCVCLADVFSAVTCCNVKCCVHWILVCVVGVVGVLEI